MSKPKQISELVTLEEKEYLKNGEGKVVEVNPTSLFLWNNCNGIHDIDGLTKLLIKTHDISSFSSGDLERPVPSIFKDLNKKGLMEFG